MALNRTLSGYFPTPLITCFWKRTGSESKRLKSSIEGTGDKIEDNECEEHS